MAEEEDFSQLVGSEVTPLTLEKRVAVVHQDKDVDKSIRRDAAVDEIKIASDPLASEPVEMLDPHGILSFQRPGVQHGVFKNLRLAKYSIDARLDLHQMTVDQARKAVYDFVNDCIANDVRAALVTHGKGVGRENPALLKSCVAHWLPQLDEVLAFHSAQKHHGGSGATYVLLKKSDKKKQEAREKNTKR